MIDLTDCFLQTNIESKKLTVHQSNLTDESLAFSFLNNMDHGFLIYFFF